MAEEKILKDEQLSEDQLDQVAGGYASETEDDIMRFKALGILPSYTKVDALASEQILKKKFAEYNIQADTKFTSANGYRYNIDGKFYDRRTVWNYICDREGIHNPFDR